jgi:predicted nicotinamide N-methyase
LFTAAVILNAVCTRSVLICALLQDQQHDKISGSTQPADAVASEQPQQQQQQQNPDLSRVGLVLWQSGYVLSDFLLLRLPQLLAGRHRSSSSSSWAGSRVLELGCGAGTVGMFLALAGAQVRLVMSWPNAS